MESSKCALLIGRYQPFHYGHLETVKEIIIPKKMNDSIISFLQTRKSGNIKITYPQKGEKKQLLDLVEKNIDMTFFADFEKLQILKSRLKLWSLWLNLYFLLLYWVLVLYCIGCQCIGGQSLSCD